MTLATMTPNALKNHVSENFGANVDSMRAADFEKLPHDVRAAVENMLELEIDCMAESADYDDYDEYDD